MVHDMRPTALELEAMAAGYAELERDMRLRWLTDHPSATFADYARAKGSDSFAQWRSIRRHRRRSKMIISLTSG